MIVQEIQIFTYGHHLIKYTYALPKFEKNENKPFYQTERKRFLWNTTDFFAQYRVTAFVLLQSFTYYAADCNTYFASIIFSPMIIGILHTVL